MRGFGQKGRMRLFACLLVLTGFNDAVSAPVAAEHWQSASYLMKSFVTIALLNENSSRAERIRKWTRPIRYFIVHRVGDQELHERLLKMHLDQLAEITGLNITPSPSRNAANLLIVFSTEDNLQNELQNEFGVASKDRRISLFRNSICLGKFEVSSDASITQAVVIVPVDRATMHAKLIDCIVEETTQVLGLPNDSIKVFPSIFNDKSVDSLLTGLDYLMLKMLYDPRLRAGMTLEQAWKPIQAIALEFERQKLFDTAEAKVRTGKLYELLY